MNNLLSMLLGSMTNQSSLNATSKKTGLSTRQILTILSYALPLIMRAMTKNASSASGAQSLLGALTQHKSTRSVADQIEAADTADGSKIIGHIFGGDTTRVMGDIAKATDSSDNDVSKVLSAMAPALLSSLSLATTTASAAQANQKKGFDLSDGIDMNDITALFGGSGAGNMTGMLGSLFGGAAQPAQPAKDDGTALLSSLLSLMK